MNGIEHSGEVLGSGARGFARLFAAVLAVGLLAETAHAAFPDKWGYQVSITITNGLIDTTLTNWTLVFDQSFDSVLTDDDGPLHGAGARASINGGGDVRFSSDQAGLDRLACDIRTWDTSTRTCEVAVLVTNVSSTVDTTIWMWWGKAGETQPAVDELYGQYAAYDSNHVVVYPGNDGAAGYNRCSSSYSHPAESGGTEVTGQLGKAQSFARSASQQYDTPSDVTEIVPQQSFTVEALAKVDDTSVDHDIALKGGAHSGTVPFMLMRDEVAFNSNTKTIMFLVNYAGGVATANRATAPSSTWNDTNWHHVGGRYTASSRISVFFDGAEAGYTGTISSPTLVPENTADSLKWGNAGSLATAPPDLAGDLSEMRLSKVSRSDAWMKANYNNLMNIGGFLTWGSIQPAAPSGPMTMLR